MKATDVIKRDHEATKVMFQQYKNASEDERKEMDHKIFKALATHEKMEDKHFYAALKEVLKDNPVVEELDRQQGELERETLEVKALDMLTGQRSERVIALLEKVINHAEKEEQEIFPLAEMELGETKLEELGEKMEPESAVAKEKE
jgi:hypothetical protein